VRISKVEDFNREIAIFDNKKEEMKINEEKEII